MAYGNVQAVGEVDRGQVGLAEGVIDDFLHVAAQVGALQRGRQRREVIAAFKGRTEQ
ncbi:hypothetical protein D9M71_591580 [compost metagenome]